MIVCWSFLLLCAKCQHFADKLDFFCFPFKVFFFSICMKINGDRIYNLYVRIGEEKKKIKKLLKFFNTSKLTQKKKYLSTKKIVEDILHANISVIEKKKKKTYTIRQELDREIQ